VVVRSQLSMLLLTAHSTYLSLDPPMTELLAGWSACGAGLEPGLRQSRESSHSSETTCHEPSPIWRR
jgi:hypothetical protein